MCSPLCILSASSFSTSLPPLVCARIHHVCEKKNSHEYDQDSHDNQEDEKKKGSRPIRAEICKISQRAQRQDHCHESGCRFSPHFRFSFEASNCERTTSEGYSFSLCETARRFLRAQVFRDNFCINPGPSSGSGPVADSYCFRCFAIIFCTRPGFAWPFVSFITKPTMEPRAEALPFL